MVVKEAFEALLRVFVEAAIWGKVEDEEHLLLVCPNTQKVKLGNTFVQPCLSSTLALLLISCRLRTWSPWTSLWHAASTGGQSILHDLPFI
jgi:hypothetical protein